MAVLLVPVDAAAAPPGAATRLARASRRPRRCRASRDGERRAAAARSLVTVPRDAALWRYELEGKRRDSAARARDPHPRARRATPVGYIVHGISLYGPNLTVMAFEVTAGVSWREAWIASLHDLKQTGDAMAAASPDTRFRVLSFGFLSFDHPLYRVFRFTELGRRLRVGTCGCPTSPDSCAP